VSSIHLAESDQEIAAWFPVMRELRTHLIEADFVAMVRRQQSGGYRLAFLREGGESGRRIPTARESGKRPNPIRG
jgi:hypothetical protein